jgi:SAM-dependent methyltransferase
MTSSYETEPNQDNGAAQHREQPPLPAGSEAAYERLSAYGFAQRYTQGKIVADVIGRQEELGGGRGGGYGLRLLAQSAESVRAVALRELLEGSGSFDVVVAFGVIEELEHPEELVREAKRALKEGGVLLISVADKKQTALEDDRADTEGKWRGMYVPEFRGLLERHFGHVRLYRQGAVAGGFVFPISEEPSGGGGAVPVESVRLSSSGPRVGVEPPMTRSVMAVCTQTAEALEEGEEGAYLLLDSERRVFYECEERAEDVELMRAEIRRMQETEVQAFVEAIKVRQSLLRELLHSPISYRNLIFEEIRYRQSIIRGNMRAIRQKGAVGSTKGVFRRLSAFYRRLQSMNRTSD